MVRRTAAAVLTLAFFAEVVFGQSVLYVNAAADPDGDGLAWESAYTDLQDALDQAHLPNSPVHEIWVAAGVYRPDRAGLSRAESFNLKSGLMVLGGFEGTEQSRAERNWAAHPTILSGDLAGDDQPGPTGIEENSYHVLMANLVDDTGQLDGFVIQGGNADGTGIYGEGAGLRMEESDVVVSHCTFRGNTSRRGGAAFDLEGSPTFAHVVFNANYATQECGGLMCNVVNYIGIHPRVLGCTFVNNISAGGGRAPLVCISIGDLMVLRNSVFQGNTWYSEENYNYLPPQFDGAISFDYVCSPQFDAPPYGGGHMAWSDDAMLVDPDGADGLAGTDDDDLRPLPGSPVIDSGDNDSVCADRFDLDDDGNTSEPLGRDLGHASRFYDDPAAPDVGHGTPPLVDMGAFEGPALAVIAAPTSLDVLEGGYEEFGVWLSRPPATPLTVSIITAPDGDQDLQPSPAQLIFDENDWDQPQTVQVSAADDVDSLDDTATIVLTANGAVTGLVAAQELDNDLPPGTIFVNAAAVGKNNGLSWTDAFKDLQKALQVALDGGGAVTQIWVAKGTYRPDQGTKNRERAFTLANGLALYGGFAGGEVSLGQRDPAANPTILSGDLNKDDLPEFVHYEDNSEHVVLGVNTDATAVLDGFTVSAGNATSDRGGGMYLFDQTTATIRNCRFTACLNSAVSLYGAGTTLFEACRFDGNRALYDGGGLVAQSWFGVCAVDLVDCEFVGNEAADKGGGAAIVGGAALSGCRFADNTAVNGSAIGGGLWIRSEPDTPCTMTECTFEANHLDNAYGQGAGACLIGSVSVTVSACEFIGNTADYKSNGGGLLIGKLAEETTAEVTDTLFASNSAEAGGGAYVGGSKLTTFNGCTFMDNSGGGLLVNGSVQSCEFLGNSTFGEGGGLSILTGSVSGCAFFGNTALSGGGAAAEDGTIFSDCTFSANIAQGQGATGGGILGRHGLDLVRCTLDGNSCTGTGGGVAMRSYNGDSANMVSCTLVGNSAVEGGGWYGNGQVFNCSFSGNSAALGGAAAISSDQVFPSEVRNCSIYGNSADQTGGLYLKDYGLRVYNTILWANTQDGPDGQSAQYDDTGDGDIVVKFRYSRVQGWDGSLGGPGNSGVDPMFFNPAGADGVVGTSDDLLDLSEESPCIDAGENAMVPADQFDLDYDDDSVEPLPVELRGTERFYDDPDTADTGVGTAPIVDIGCHETIPQGRAILCYADLNEDRTLDLFDFLAFVNLFNAADPVADCDGSGLLDLFDFLCFVNEFNEGC